MIPGIFAAAFRSDQPAPPVDQVGQSVARKVLSWWDFDGDLIDAAGSNDLSGSATYAPGHIGLKAVKDSRLTKVDASLPRLLSSSGAMSFGGWIYLAGTGGEDIEIRFGTSTAGQRYRIAFRSGNQAHLVVGEGPSTTISSPVGAVSTGNYYFVAATLEARTGALALYIDGNLVASGEHPRSFPFADTISFGRVSGNVFNALHNDSSFIADDVLTSAEIGWLYNDGAGRSFADLPPSNLAKGVWTWFNDPRAILIGGELVIGNTGQGGDIKVSRYSESTGLLVGEVVLQPGGSPDDHDNPALLRRSDGTLLAAYARHNANSSWLVASANPDDASSWGSEFDIAPQLDSSTYSYANLFQLTGEAGSPIFNVYRGGAGSSWSPHVGRSDDGGTTWEEGVRLLDGGIGGRPYLKATQNGENRIDFAVSDGHPDAVATNSIRHFYYQGGDWFDSGGNSLGAPPFNTASDLSTVYDGSITRAWVWDIQIGPDGHPRVLFSTFPSVTDHRYHYARWTGAEWVTAEICAAGTHLYAAEPYYSGGMCIDPDDTNVAYASRESGGRWGLYRYTTSDGGASWVESDLGVEGLRPYAPKGSRWLIYLVGRYTTYTDFGTSIALLKRGAP